jgi:hypothetical protein
MVTSKEDFAKHAVAQLVDIVCKVVKALVPGKRRAFTKWGEEFDLPIGSNNKEFPDGPCIVYFNDVKVIPEYSMLMMEVYSVYEVLAADDHMAMEFPVGLGEGDVDAVERVLMVKRHQQQAQNEKE